MDEKIQFVCNFHSQTFHFPGMQLPENGGILKGKYHTFMFNYNYIYNIVIQRYVNDTHNSVNMFILYSMKYSKGYVLLNVIIVAQE